MNLLGAASKLGILPISYNQTKKLYSANPVNLLYSISAISFLVYCYYVHWKSPHATYYAADFQGERTIAQIFGITYVIIHIFLLISCYWQAGFNRKEFEAVFNKLIMVEDRLSTHGKNQEYHPWM
jgi:7tm Chemosensory receptor